MQGNKFPDFLSEVGVSKKMWLMKDLTRQDWVSHRAAFEGDEIKCHSKKKDYVFRTRRLTECWEISEKKN